MGKQRGVFRGEYEIFAACRQGCTNGGDADQRLDHHRNQEKQQIVVQHITTAQPNQAVVTDSVVTGNNNDAAFSPKLLATVTDKPMEILEAEKQRETVPVGGGGAKEK